MSARAGLLVIFFCLFTTLFAAPAQAVVAGTRDYNFTTHQMQFFDGSQWYNFGPALSLLQACTREGSMEFDALLSSYEVCNGTVWVKIVGTLTLSGCSNKGAMEYTASTYRVCNGLLWVDIKGGSASS